MRKFKYIKLFEKFSINERNIIGTQNYKLLSDSEKSEMKKIVFDLFDQLSTEVADGEKEYYFKHGNGDTGHFVPSKGSMVYKDNKNMVYFYDDINVNFGDKKNYPESTLYIIAKLPLNNIKNKEQSAMYFRELCAEALYEIHNIKIDNIEYN